MEVNVPELEQRLLHLQWQVERLSQVAEQNVGHVEQRLAGMADQYAENLKRWAVTADRHARTVTQLESYVGEWREANSRIQQDTSQRLRELETIIHHEWDALRTVHEQPARELREQAASLAEACIAAANVAQSGFERAEARLASFEDDVHLILGEFGRDLQAAVKEMRARPAYQSPRLESAAPWSLDDVTRLHGQLRDSAEAAPATDPTPASAADLTPSAPRAIEAVADQNRIFSDRSPSPDQSAGWKWRFAAGALAVALTVAGGFGWYLQNQVQIAAERARQAELESQKAAGVAARQAAEAREEAAREIASARELATRAELVGTVLAAPDLIRWSLSGGGGSPLSGQALWSRTRGFVFSGSRIPPAAPNGTYHVWLLTRLAPVRASTFAPAPDGTVTLALQGLNVPRAVVGVMVTAEGPNAADAPSGEPVLTSVPPAPVE